MWSTLSLLHQVHWHTSCQIVPSHDEQVRECSSRVQSVLAQLHTPVSPPPHASLLWGPGLCLKLLVRAVSWGHCCHSNKYFENPVIGKAGHHLQPGGHTPSGKIINLTFALSPDVTLKGVIENLCWQSSIVFNPDSLSGFLAPFPLSWSW